jgi:hypothetical protein
MRLTLDLESAWNWIDGDCGHPILQGQNQPVQGRNTKSIRAINDSIAPRS